MYILGPIFILIGMGILFTAKSAIHEIEAFIVLLIGTVLLCSGSVVAALERIRKEILIRWPEEEKELPLYHSSRPSNRVALRNGFVIAVLILLALALIPSRDRLPTILLQWFSSTEQSPIK